MRLSPVYTVRGFQCVSVAEAGFVILSVAKDLNMAQILRFAQNDMGWLPLFRNKNSLLDAGRLLSNNSLYGEM
jgi:hypothetical protein